VPNPTGEMEIKGINIMDFQDSVDTVMLESHSEERCLKDGSGSRGIKNGVKGNNISRVRRSRESKMRLHRHNEIEW
jgi:hypothetical protein